LAAVLGQNLSNLRVIIGLSATALEKEKAICIESGMNDLIAKTVRSEQLIEFLHAHMDIQ